MAQIKVVKENILLGKGMILLKLVKSPLAIAIRLEAIAIRLVKENFIELLCLSFLSAVDL